jgi:hypothetical protein
MTTAQKRAAVGGEFGANGEWYEGGKFINTVADNAKRQAKRSSRKEQVAPYKWEVVPEGMQSIFDFVASDYCRLIDGKLTVRTDEYADNAFAYSKTSRAFVQSLCDRWNAGERWVRIAEKFEW